MEKGEKMKVKVFLKRGFEEVEAITVIDYLRRAGIIVEVVSFEETKEVEGGHRIKIIADIMAEDLVIDKETAIYIPGGMLQMVSLQNDKRVLEYLQKANSLHCYIIGICAGPMVMEKAGILKGKVITSFPGLESGFKTIERYSEKRIFRDDNIITARGPELASELAYYLIELFKGSEIRRKIEKETLYCFQNMDLKEK